jgi:hypothetical protein
MKKIIMIGMLLIFPRVMCGQSGKANQSTALRSPQKLEVPRPAPAVIAEQNRVRRLLGPGPKRVIQQMEPAFQNQLTRLPATANYYQLATSEVRKQFPHVSPNAVDVLSFELLSEVADNTSSEMSETESLRLQMTMDRRSKLIETLSNVLKKSSDTGDSVVQNLK